MKFESKLIEFRAWNNNFMTDELKVINEMLDLVLVVDST
jgi:hypothetical protein